MIINERSFEACWRAQQKSPNNGMFNNYDLQFFEGDTEAVVVASSNLLEGCKQEYFPFCTTVQGIQVQAGKKISKGNFYNMLREKLMERIL